MEAPCKNKPEYTNPTKYPPHTIEAAILRCNTCPILKECATQALTSGGTLDGKHITPATGVIQAGIKCRGDRDTAKKLSTIAQVPLPATPHHPKFIPPKTCRQCGKEMATRDKNKPTHPNIPTHSSHGYCRACDAHRRRQPGYQPTHRTTQQVLEGRHAH